MQQMAVPGKGDGSSPGPSLLSVSKTLLNLQMQAIQVRSRKPKWDLGSSVWQ